MNGQEHLYDVLAAAQEVAGFVEKAVAQTGTHQNAEKAIDEEGVEIFFLYLLLFVELVNEQIGQQQADEPAE